MYGQGMYGAAPLYGMAYGYPGAGQAAQAGRGVEPAPVKFTEVRVASDLQQRGFKWLTRAASSPAAPQACQQLTGSCLLWLTGQAVHWWSGGQPDQQR